MRRLLVANLVLAVPVISWGAPIPFMDTHLDRWDPVLSIAVRYLIAMPVLYLFWRLLRPAGGRSLLPPGVPLAGVLRLSLMGLSMFALAYTYGLDHTQPVTAAVLSAAAPVIAAVVARFFFGQPLARGYGLAILLSLVGGTLAVIDPDSIEGFELRGGEPLMLLAAAIWSWYSLEVQRLMPGVPQVQAGLLTIIPTAFAMPLLYLLLLALGLAGPPPQAGEVRWLDLGILGWFGVFAISAAIVTWNTSVKLVGVVVASLYLNLVPVVAMLVALALGERPRVLQVIGCAIVIAGVVQAQLRLAAAERARRPCAEAA